MSTKKYISTFWFWWLTQRFIQNLFSSWLVHIAPPMYIEVHSMFRFFMPSPSNPYEITFLIFWQFPPPPSKKIVPPTMTPSFLSSDHSVSTLMDHKYGQTWSTWHVPRTWHNIDMHGMKVIVSVLSSVLSPSLSVPEPLLLRENRSVDALSMTLGPLKSFLMFSGFQDHDRGRGSQNFQKSGHV